MHLLPHQLTATRHPPTLPPASSQGTHGTQGHVSNDAVYSQGNVLFISSLSFPLIHSSLWSQQPRGSR